MKRKKPIEAEVLSPAALAPVPVYDGSLDGLAKLLKGDLESGQDVRRRIIELLRGEDDMGKFVKAFDKKAKGRSHVTGRGDTPSLDAVCELSGVRRSEAFGAIARVLHRYHFDVAQLQISAVIANRAREVTEQLALQAALPLGHQDRALFMDVAGARKKAGGGVTVNVAAQANANSESSSQSAAVSGRELPAFEEGIRGMAAKLRQIQAGQ